jgi:hypothetical protein
MIIDDKYVRINGTDIDYVFIKKNDGMIKLKKGKTLYFKTTG